MSRTFKTRPLWVNLRTGYLPSQAVHNHETTVCDLPALDQLERKYWTNCYWEFSWDGRNICACQLCHGWWESYFPTRSAERRNTRIKLNAQRHEYTVR